MNTNPAPSIERLVEDAAGACIFGPPSASYVANKLVLLLWHHSAHERGVYLCELLTNGTPFVRRVAALTAHRLYVYRASDHADDEDRDKADKKTAARSSCELAAALGRYALDRTGDPYTRSIALLAREKLESIDSRVPRLLSWDRYDIAPGVDELRCLVGGSDVPVAVAAAEALEKAIPFLSSPAATIVLEALLEAIENGDPAVRRASISALGQFGRRIRFLSEPGDQDGPHDEAQWRARSRTVRVLHRYLGDSSGEERAAALTACCRLSLYTTEAHEALLLALAEVLSPAATFSLVLTALSFVADSGEIGHALTALRGRAHGDRVREAIETAIARRSQLGPPKRTDQPTAAPAHGRAASQLVPC